MAQREQSLPTGHWVGKGRHKESTPGLGLTALHKSVSLPDRTSSSPRGLSLALVIGKVKDLTNIRAHVFILALSFLMARASMFEILFPFGIALMAAVMFEDRNRVASGTIGITLGLFTVLQPIKALVYALAAVALPAARSAFDDNVLLDSPWRLGLLTTFISGMFLGLGGLLMGYDGHGMLVVVLESVVAGASAIVFQQALPYLTGSQPLSSLPIDELIYLVLLPAMAAAGVHGVAVGPVDLHIALAATIVIITAYLAGSNAGAAVGVVVGVLFGLTGDFSSLAVGLFAFSGWVAGFFRELGRWVTAIGFSLTYVVALLYFGEVGSIDPSVYAVMAAAVGAIFIPIGSRDQFLMTARGHHDGRDVNRFQNHISNKLSDFGKVFHQLGAAFIETQGVETAEPDGDLNRLFGAIAKRVCDGCQDYSSCWEQGFYQTYRKILELMSVAERRGSLSVDAMSAKHRDACRKPGDLVSTINYVLEARQIDGFWNSRLKESREVVHQQFMEMGNILTSLAGEAKNYMAYSAETAAVLRREILAQSPAQLELQASGSGLLDLEVQAWGQPCPSGDFCTARFAPSASRILGQRMGAQVYSCPHQSDDDSECRFVVAAQPVLDYVSGVALRAKEDGGVCGDTYLIKEVSTGKLLLILSDGMGAGPRAARESEATVGLLEQFLSVGFDTRTAVQTINSILMLRSWEEVFATLDLAVIDLYTGSTELVKIGAESSFMVSGKGSVAAIRSSTIPIGILDSVEVPRETRTLQSYDTLLMVTDGVLAAEDSGEWIGRLLAGCKDCSPQYIADLVLEKAKERSPAGQDDDMVVLACKILPRLTS